MATVSDSEGACSDYEIISSSSNRTVQEEPSDPGTPAEDENRICTVSINEASQLLTSDSSPTTSIFSTVTSSSSTSLVSDEIIQQIVEDQTERESEHSDGQDGENASDSTYKMNSSSISQRRERRDTDRRNQRKMRKDRKIWVWNVVALLLLSLLCLHVYLYPESHKGKNNGTNQEGINKELEKKLANLEQTNKIILAALEKKDEGFRAEFFEMERENWKLKQEIKEMAEKVEIATVKLVQAEEMIKALKSMAEEDGGAFSDRYGFDIPFNFCNDILNHEKLCRLLSEGLKTVNDHIFD